MAATAEAPARSRARANSGKTAGKAKVKPEDFLRVMRFLDTEVLVERALETRVIVLATLAGINAHLNGEPGVAKSLGLDQFAKCIVDATYFKKPLNEELAPSRVIGEYDLAEFAQTGHLARKTEGYAPQAHIVFIDEVFRANGMMLDALLPLMNVGEREAEHNGGMMKAPTLVIVSAANFTPDPDNTRAQAFIDRVSVMIWVERVKANDSFKEILRRSQARRENEATGALNRETVTLAQAQEAQRQVRAVRHTPEYLDAIAELRASAIREGLPVSDRRWVELDLFAHANAWLAGRDHLIPEDLAVCEYGMAREKAHVAVAHKLVLPFHGRFEREATEKRQEAAPAIAKIEEIRPLVEGTPPSEELDPDVLRKAISAARAVDTVKERVDQVVAEADKEKRDAAGLRELSNELLAIQMWLHSNSLPTKYKG